MNINTIKEHITEIHKDWEVLGDSSEDLKMAEIYETAVIEIISDYCQAKNYQVDGFPFKTRKTQGGVEIFDQKYYCIERYQKYLDILLTKYKDVLDIMHHYNYTFWPDQTGNKKEYKATVKHLLTINFHDIEF